MGKNSEHHNSSVSIENNHPGCMWSILHVLKYHHWRYIKKKLHHKSGNRKHAK
ncbi:PROTEIN TRM32, partial [Salix purpurea]